MEDERQDSALGNHMERLDADEPRCLLGHQWRHRVRYNGMTLLAMSEIKDEMFAFSLVALVAVHPIKAGDGDDDYIAVVMDATLCHMDLYAGAQERGLQFADGYPEDGDDVLVAFSTVEVARDQIIKERAEAAAKPTK